ncbi:hypothetical protein SSX86_006237 [Deinandra increscens subsp. villosa]|uniref:Aluminum-activated malate transporter n=1 Tax=Deinandra increscens subsp. villosa TaxID=3103831 RepID=A0AAP0DMB7_9ASTR
MASKEKLLSRKGLFEESDYNVNNEDGFAKLWEDVKGFLVNVYEMGQSDPRQIIFAAKSGLALAFVSVLIFFKEPFSYISHHSIWAILTVINIFEFSIGGTFYKGIIGGYGIFFAGIPALGMAQLSTLAGEWQEFVVVIAIFIAECVMSYLQSVEYERIPSKILVYQATDDPLYTGYRTAVESTSEEDALLAFAIWEPPHGPYRMRYPWSEFVKVSGALRHCAFMVMSMHGCILSEIQAAPELRLLFRNEIQRVGFEGAKVLRELGNKLEKLEKLSPGFDLLDKVHEAAEELQMLIDQKSYHLVKSEKWEAKRRPKEFEDPNHLQEIKDEETTMDQSLTEETSKQSLHTLKNLDHHNMSYMSNNSFLGHGVNSEEQVQWPSRLSVIGDIILNEREIRTYESATALSLANFTSSLIEFVARLQNLLNSYQELSDKAIFSEPT